MGTPRSPTPTLRLMSLTTLTVVLSLTFAADAITSNHGLSRVAAYAAEGDTAPAWLRNEMAALTRGSGRWIADNSPFKSANEPWDHYVVEWTWGVDRQTLVGRLYGVRSGTDTVAFWDFRLFWHPSESRAVLYQFGVGGTLGAGPMESDGNGGTVAVQIFHQPDGSTSRVRHESRFDGDVHVTQSLHWVNGAWVKNREYRWMLAPSNPNR